MSSGRSFLLRGWNVGVIPSLGIPSGLQGLTSVHGIITSLTVNSQPPLPLSTPELAYMCLKCCVSVTKGVKLHISGVGMSQDRNVFPGRAVHPGERPTPHEFRRV
jgi:hypothetical protein